MSDGVPGFTTGHRPIKMPKAADLVADDLRREIARGTFRDSAELPQGTVLLERYGISRPTLREALRVLASENLITLTARTQGARVTLPSAEVAARYAGVLLQLRGTTLLDLEQTRAVIEPPAARLLAEAPERENRTGELCAALDAEAEALRSEDPVAAGQAGLAFHECVVRLSGNSTLHATFTMLQSVLQLHTEVRLRQEATEPGATTELDDLAAAHRAHRKLLRLLEESDPDAVERHWLQHSELSTQALVGQDDARRVVDIL